LGGKNQSGGKIMMKKVWPVLLAVVLVFGFAVLGCGGGGSGEPPPPPEEKFEFEGPWDGVIQPWGNNKPTIEGNEISVTASQSTGFFIDFADIGYEYNAADVLIFTYEIVEITTPSAVLTLKNPSNWPGDMAGASNWGVGKGREYVLGDETRSNYEAGDAGKIVSGTYDPETKVGTFEVLAGLLTRATSVGFQHNAWAEFDGEKVAENSVYKIKITKIENAVSDIPPPPPPPPPGEIGGNLGPVTVVNSASQKGWATNGTDDLETDLDIVDLINAQYLKLVMGSKPTGGIQLIWQGDGDDWTWDSTEIATGSFVVDSTKGAVWDDETKALTIELSLALKNYDKLKDSYKAKVFIGYYSPDFDGLGIVTADLIASETPINFVFVTFDADGGEWDIGTAEKPEVVDVQIVRLISGETMGSKFPANPLKEGFHIEKWVDAEDVEYTSTTVIDANVTLTAVWAAGEAVKWTVTFATDGGSTAPAPITDIPDGTAIGVTNFPDNPTKAGNIFAGWFDGETQYTALTAIRADVTVTAKWTAIVYPEAPSVTFSGAGLKKVQDLSRPDAGNSLGDWALGKGYIRGDDLAAIKAKTDGTLVLYVVVTNSSTAQAGYGIGRLGLYSSETNNITVTAGFTKGETFFVKIAVNTIEGLADATELFANIWSDSFIQKIELWEPDPDAGVFQKVRELGTSDWAYQDNGANKGKIKNDVAVEVEAMEGAVFRIYITGTVFSASNPQPGWGVGKFGTIDINVPNDAPSSAEGTAYSGYVDIEAESIELESDTYDTDIINVNIYSGFVIDKIEIWAIQ
jgi:uncharacterized repeat protein (TIGR02543 family)